MSWVKSNLLYAKGREIGLFADFGKKFEKNMKKGLTNCYAVVTIYLIKRKHIVIKFQKIHIFTKEGFYGTEGKF